MLEYQCGEIGDVLVAQALRDDRHLLVLALAALNAFELLRQCRRRFRRRGCGASGTLAMPSSPWQTAHICAFCLARRSVRGEGRGRQRSRERAAPGRALSVDACHVRLLWREPRRGRRGSGSMLTSP